MTSLIKGALIVLLVITGGCRTREEPGRDAGAAEDANAAAQVWRVKHEADYNRYTTCPIPLRENRLPVKVLAGEGAYRK